MIIAHHIILTGYGHWLPNDPRGSLSCEFRCEKLGDLGGIHFGRKRVQPSPEDIKSFYVRAAQYLKHPVLWFDTAKRQAVGEAFGELIRREGLTCYACGVLRNHAHLLIRRHRISAKEMIELLKDASRDALAAITAAPVGHPVWSEDPFVAYKDTPEAVATTVSYIRKNFTKHSLPPQDCSFVVPYDNWPFHKRLRPKPLR